MAGKRNNGNVLAEYGLVLALIAGVCYVALGGLGTSISALIARGDGGGSTRELFALLNADGAGGASGSAQTPGTTGIPGASGQTPGLLPGTTGSGNGNNITGASNTTSVEGDIATGTLGSLQLGSSLQALADAATDPEAKAYYEKMAKKAYYLGGAEGEIDGVPGLALDANNGGIDYNKADALEDIYKNHHELMALMNEPPASIAGNPDFGTAKVLAQEATRISGEYLSTLSRFMGPDGKATSNFGISTTVDWEYHAGTGEPGSGLANADQYRPLESIQTKTPYENVFDYGTMQKKADSILATNNVGTVRVRRTLGDAVALDTRSGRR